MKFMKKRKSSKRVLSTGNEAIGAAAIKAGCRFYAGYPITPQNELTAFMARHMREEGRAFVQAESELAAVNMVFGASATGVRAMTSSSSPGISLKQEGISYLSGCQLPALIVNVQRGGPGLGNIAPSQSDYFQAVKGGGHGDYRLIVLAPSSVQECFDFTLLAFDLADKYRNPVMLLLDAFIGQMAEPLILKPPVTSHQSPVNKKWALTGAMGRNPNVIRSLFLGEGELEKWNLFLQKKYKEIEKKENRWESLNCKESEILFVSYGISFRIAREAAKVLKERYKINAGFFRPKTLFPYPYKELRQAAKGKKAVFVFELSYGQMVEDVRLSLEGSVPVNFYGRAGGGVFTPEEIVSFVKKRLK